MDKISHSFSEDEIKLVNIYRDNQEDGRLKVRFIALLLFARGNTLHDISAIVGYSPKSIERWIQQYLANGIDSLNDFGYKPKKPALEDEQLQQLIDWVRNANPPNLKSIVRYVQEAFQVTYSISGVEKLLKKNGLNDCVPR